MALLAALVVCVLAAPATASANGFFAERSLAPVLAGVTFSSPVISGDNVIYMEQTSVPGATWILLRFNFANSGTNQFQANGTQHALTPQISGDWVVWQQNGDIKAKNIKTGAYKNVTNDAATTDERLPVISGTLVVWWSFNGTSWDLKGKDLATTASPFLVIGGTANQYSPSISGKRVAYLDTSNGFANVYVKTIGSSAAPLKVTNNTLNQSSPSIGDHLVAWTVHNGNGKDMIRYYDYNTGVTSDGPSNASYDVSPPRVSGDRILYSLANGSDTDLLVFDARVAKVTGALSVFPLATTADDDKMGAISGNEVVYISGATPMWGKLLVPAISLNKVPKRIAHGGHIHLTGSIREQGHILGSVAVNIEKYSSGRWNWVKTIPCPKGTFSYKTPPIHSKTLYRVSYDGRFATGAATVTNHFSTVSGTKTAWPR
jgi:hypothetical protein